MSTNSTIGTETRTKAKASGWIRSAGLATVLGGILWTTLPVVDPLLFNGALFPRLIPGNPGYTPFLPLAGLALPAFLLLVGLWALHVYETGARRWLEWAGFGVTAVGLVVTLAGGLSLTLGTTDPFGIPNGADLFFFLGHVIAYAGSSVHGIALWRTKNVSRLYAGLLAISLPVTIPLAILVTNLGLDFLASVAFNTPYGVAWAGIGYYLWSNSISVSPDATAPNSAN